MRINIFKVPKSINLIRGNDSPAVHKHQSKILNTQNLFLVNDDTWMNIDIEHHEV